MWMEKFLHEWIGIRPEVFRRLRMLECSARDEAKAGVGEGPVQLEARRRIGTAVAGAGVWCSRAVDLARL